MIDFEQMKAFYQLGYNLTLADAQVLLGATQEKALRAGDYLFQPGSTQRTIFFITKGLLRSFHINDKGEEITLFVRYEHHIIASSNVILFEQPAQFYVEALEDTELLCIDYDVLQSILAQHPKLANNRQLFLHSLLKETIERVHSFVLLSPEARYLQYIASNPTIFNRVPNKYIANILGITPVSLSRIRKRIATRKK